MALHMDLGRLAEEKATEFLRARGYRILHRNWRAGSSEIDIIALQNNLLHFVEVKCRSKGSPIRPEENVTRKKLCSLLRGVDAFLTTATEHRHFQLDILSVTLDARGNAAFFMLPDVYL